MRSIWAKVLAWSLGTFGLSLVVFWGLTQLLAPPPTGQIPPILGMLAAIEDDTCRIYEEKGSDALRAHMRRLDRFMPGQHILTDREGKDLTNGQDRSKLLALFPRGWGAASLPDGRVVFMSRPRRGRYRFLAIVRSWYEAPPVWPYYAGIALVIVLMTLALALYLVEPLRKLRRVVDRFGRGDLSARSGSRRKDEIGALSRDFDRMAERIELLLGAERRLLQDVSHELRSPLTRINFAVTLARLEEDREAALDQITKDVGRLSHLISELLKLTRGEGDAAARLHDEVGLDWLLEELIADGSIEAEAQGCRLVRTNPGADATVEGDAELLRLAVENVIRNAIRHSPQGGDIEIGLEPGTSSTRITVRDHGQGVPDEVLESIFMPFFRVDDDRNHALGGTGLGLSIARRAIALHRGCIKASNAKPGLRVTIELPTTFPGSSGEIVAIRDIAPTA